MTNVLRTCTMLLLIALISTMSACSVFMAAKQPEKKRPKPTEGRRVSSGIDFRVRSTGCERV